MTRAAPVLLWFRQDLRLTDHAALAAAVNANAPVVPVFVLDEQAMGDRAYGGASRWWLHHSLAALGATLRDRGSRLILRRGRWAEVLPDLARAVGACAVHAGRLYEPWAREADKSAAEALRGADIAIHGHRTTLLHDPWAVKTGSGGAYSVYTPFSRAIFAADPPPAPLPAPDRIAAPESWPESDALESWALLPQDPDWAGGLRETWRPGEGGAASRLTDFLAAGLKTYDADRNRPDLTSTSMLSPYLRWGEVSPGQVWHAATIAAGGSGKGLETFLKELLWREFSYHLLWHRPEMPEAPLRAEFARFPWRDDPRALRAWKRGRTGVPIVDAGMRQLWHTGWMHNRVRMVVASYLVKHLLVPWQKGERWFWDTLVDADLASNTASWQWVAGSGADAAPYFRIFNPVLQGLKFDPDGTYVRRWVPELARLTNDAIHRPWAEPEALRRAGIALGRDYPEPLVDLDEGRGRALAALATISRSAA